LISGPSPVANTYLLFFNRKQYRVVNGFLAGQKTPRRHLYITGLIDSPVCRRCEAEEEENSAHVLCECEVLTTLRYTYPRTWTSLQGTERACRKPTCIGAEKARTHHLFQYLTLWMSIFRNPLWS